MSPEDQMFATLSFSFPRVSGDEPLFSAIVLVLSWFSPREWG